MAVAIALGGGAPNLTLMTGALLALDEAGVNFKVITTTGAGMVAGLLYAAPRRENPAESWQDARRRALLATREMGIDDLIYEQFPVNYKIFQKAGPLAEAYAHVVNPAIWSIPRETRRQRLLGDTLGFFAAAMQPGSLSSKSQGLCQPPPWIDILVDFSELVKNLEDGDRAFALSAYCIEDQKERTFRKKEITAEHFKAGLAMPFLYSPYKLKDADGKTKTYLEGSAIRTMQFNPDDIMTDKEISTLIYFDLMGNRHLMGEPKNLIDAWGKSIVAPLTQLAYLQEQLVDLKRFTYSIMTHNAELISSFNDMTMEIERLLEDNKSGQNFQLKSMIKDIEKKIHDARVLRKGVIDDSERVLNKLAEDRDSDEDDILMNEGEPPPEQGGSEVEGHVESKKLAMDNMLRYLGDTMGEWKKISEFGGEAIDPENPRMLRMPFRDHVPADQWPKVLDWTHSNMSTLFDIGYDTAQCFIQHNWQYLDLEEQPKQKELRYFSTRDHAHVGHDHSHHEEAAE